MKLLFGYNLSPRLVGRVADIFPESAYVYSLDLAEAEDIEVWHYAQEHGFTKHPYKQPLTLQAVPLTNHAQSPNHPPQPVLHLRRLLQT